MHPVRQDINDNEDIMTHSRRTEPILRISDMATALTFYLRILDFQLCDPKATPVEPVVAVTAAGATLVLSAYDGTPRIPVNILVEEDIDALFHKFLSRGLVTPGNPDSPVHEGPLDQSWGSREFYVNDPDGNTLRFCRWPD